MPHGYGWVFPMGKNLLKVGTGYFKFKNSCKDITKPLNQYVKQIVNDYLKLTKYKTIDIHGSTLQYCKGQNDIYYKDKIVAIGDAVSCVNPLGGEGIRHSMYSANLASKSIDDFLNGDEKSFDKYEKAMKKYFGKK